MTSKAVLRQAVEFLVGNWFSRAYLLGVLAATLFAVVANLGSEGPSFAGIYLMLLTCPWSMLSVPVALAGPEWLAPAALLTAAAVGAVINGVLLGGFVHLIKGARRPRPLA